MQPESNPVLFLQTLAEISKYLSRTRWGLTMTKIVFLASIGPLLSANKAPPKYI